MPTLFFIRTVALAMTLALIAIVSLPLSIQALWPNQAQAEGLVSVGDIKREILSRNSDALELLLTQVATMQSEGAVIPFLADLWDGRADKYPEIPWDFVKSDPVKLDIGHVLLIAANFWAPGAHINKQDLHNYALSLIDDIRPTVTRRALAILASFDDPRDVEAIVLVAKQERVGTFKISVVALAQMCNLAAQKALSKLEQMVQLEENIEFIRETRSEFDMLKAERSLCQDPASELQ